MCFLSMIISVYGRFQNETERAVAGTPHATMFKDAVSHIFHKYQEHPRTLSVLQNLAKPIT